MSLMHFIYSSINQLNRILCGSYASKNRFNEPVHNRVLDGHWVHFYPVQINKLKRSWNVSMKLLETFLIGSNAFHGRPGSYRVTRSDVNFVSAKNLTSERYITCETICWYKSYAIESQTPTRGKLVHLYLDPAWNNFKTKRQKGRNNFRLFTRLFS